MYPEITIGTTVYDIDIVGPFIAIVFFIACLYGLIKYHQLRFRDIVTKIPLIIILPVLFGNYTHFILQSNLLLPRTVDQFLILFSLSVDTIDFVGYVFMLFFVTRYTIKTFTKTTRKQIGYILLGAMLMTLTLMGVFYVLGDAVVGEFNDGFFSVGSFLPQSRIAQLGGSVYPVGLMISGLSFLSLVGLWYVYHHSHYQKYLYSVLGGFFIGYSIILQYQHYPRYFVMNILGFQFDIKVYLCIAIACFIGYLHHREYRKARLSR